MASNNTTSFSNIEDSSNNVVDSVKLTGTTYESEGETAIESGNYGSKTVDKLSYMCIKADDYNVWKILITLGESKWIEK